jgi:hypothetical protein
MKILNWFKDNWFLFVLIIIFYTILRLTGHDIKIYNVNDPLGIREKIDY